MKSNPQTFHQWGENEGRIGGGWLKLCHFLGEGRNFKQTFVRMWKLLAILLSTFSTPSSSSFTSTMLGPVGGIFYWSAFWGKSILLGSFPNCAAGVVKKRRENTCQFWKNICGEVIVGWFKFYFPL